jgi:hypothetical protein
MTTTTPTKNRVFEEYGSLRNVHGGNKSKRFKNQTCYEH